MIGRDALREELETLKFAAKASIARAAGGRDLPVCWESRRDSRAHWGGSCNANREKSKCVLVMMSFHMRRGE